MSIDIYVYCLERPDINDLKKIGLEDNDMWKGTYMWWIKKPQEGFMIHEPSSTPHHYHTSFDPEEWEGSKEYGDGIIQKAKKRHIKIPQDLTAKLKRDWEAHKHEVHKGWIPSGDEYLVLADQEYLALFNKHPEISELDDQFITVFRIADFANGSPVYEVHLSANAHSHPDELKVMVKFAEYFAQAFNGIVYDPQSGRTGTPDAAKLHSGMVPLILAVQHELGKEGLIESISDPTRLARLCRDENAN